MRRTKQPKSEHDHEAEILAARFSRSQNDHDFARLLRCMEVTVESEARDSAAGDKVLEQELVAVAARALAYAAETWDAEKGRKFVTWAKVCIRSRLIDAARYRKRHPGLSIDVEDDETVDEVLDRAAADEGTEDSQVESVDLSLRAQLVKEAWGWYARSIDTDDPPLFESYVFALVAGNRLPRAVGYLVLTMALKKSGQLMLFAHEQGQVAHQDDATDQAKEMFAGDGWLAATYLLQGYSVGDVGIELVLPTELVQAILDRVRSVAEKALAFEGDQVAA